MTKVAVLVLLMGTAAAQPVDGPDGGSPVGATLAVPDGLYDPLEGWSQGEVTEIEQRRRRCEKARADLDLFLTDESYRYQHTSRTVDDYREWRRRDCTGQMETMRRKRDVRLAAEAHAAEAAQREAERARVRMLEQEAAAAAAREGERQATLREEREIALRGLKANQRVAWSAYICAARDGEAQGRDVIAHERRSASIAGIIDKSELRRAQEEILEAQDQVAEARAELRRIGAGALGCRHPRVLRTLDCVYGKYGGCDPDELAHATATIVQEWPHR